MKKFLLSIFALMLAVFSVQAEDATLSFANKAQRTSFSSTMQVWQQNGVTFTNNKASSTNTVADYANPVRLYANSELVIECTSGNITTIVFDCNSSSYATALKNSIGTTATTSVSSDKVTVTLDGTSNSFTVAKLTAQVRLDALTVTYTTATGEGGGTPDVPVIETVATPVITAESTTFNEGESLFVTIETVTEGATIYYTTNDSVPSKTNGTEYTAPFEITATTTVKAIAVKEGFNNSNVAATTFTAIDPNATTATLSFANKAQRTEYTTSKQVWEQNGVKLTNDKGSSTTNVGDYAAPARFYKSSNIKIEATRPISKIEFNCVSGNVISISGATTSGTIVTVNVNPASTVYELTLSAQARLNSLTVTYASGDSPESAVTAAPALPASANFENEFEVTITAEEGTTIYYTTDGTKPTTGSTIYSTPFTIIETTTVKAIAVKNDVESTVAEATYTKVKLIDLSNCTVSEAIEAYKNGQTGEATITGYIVGAADGALSKAQFTSDTSVESNILIADNADETDVKNCMPIKLASKTVIRSALNIAENKNVYKKKVTIECKLEDYFSVAGTQTVETAGLYWNVTDAGYATLYLGYKVEIPSTVKAYIVTGIETGYVTLTQVEGIVAANTGLILEGKGEHLFNITSAATTANVDDNLLEGTVVATEIEEDAYVLSIVDGEVGLYKATTANMARGFLNNANKAYLPASAVPASAALSAGFRFDFGGTTAIEEVETEVAETVIYDLTGRRVNEITKAGVYIVNGKKVLVK